MDLAEVDDMVSSDDTVDDEGISDGDPRPTPMPFVNTRRWPLAENPGLAGIGPILSRPSKSTPLDSDREMSDMPSGPLWAMKYLRHGQLESSMFIDDRIRWAATDDDPRTVAYVIDDGNRHCMLSRTVGSGPDQATYHLVARVKRLDFEDVRSGWVEVVDLWEKGKDITLCAVAQGAISNVVRVARYRRLRDVPREYLPPSDLITFNKWL